MPSAPRDSATPDLEALDRSLRREADALLAGGLVDLLRRFGRPHISGSYALRLMTWRDLDIYLEMEPLDRLRFLELGRQIGESLRPQNLAFTDHCDFPATEGLIGLYWGVRTDLLSRGGWKLDIWGMRPDQCAAALAHGDALAARIGERERRAILAIKHELCRHPAYRDTITSQQIYDAVLTAGATSVADFWRFVG